LPFKRNLQRYSSGIMTLYLALRLCQQVTVYGYGGALHVGIKLTHDP
jgi:hypothetical protein